MRYSTAFVLGLWVGNTLAEESKVMRLGTNVMPPYTVITEGRQLAGQATETLNCVFDALPSYRYETSIAPWPRVVRLADQGSIDGWFLYVRNATSDRFAELSEPLQLETWYWYSHQPIGDAVLSDFLDDSILVLNGTYQQVWLQAQGFSNFLTVQSNDSLVRAFVARRADHLLISDSVFDETLAGLNGELAGVERRFVGYIQLGLYVTNDYLAEHPEFMRRFNSAAHACRSDNPELTEADRRQLQSLVDELAQWKDADWMRQSLTDMNRTNQYLTRTEIETLDSSWIAQFDTLKGRQTRWFRIRSEDAEIAGDGEVEAWLRDVDRRMWRAIFDDKARFSDRSFEVDLDLVTFGTGVFFVEEIVGRGLNFRAFHLRDTLVAENNLGEIDTVFRTLRLTARQAAQQFGEDRLGAKTREALRDEAGKSEARFRFLHVVVPRDDADAAGRRFASKWIDVASEHLIGEGGYHEFPYAVPRWETVTGEVYGRSPGMLALADAQTLNAMSATLLKAGQKAVDPPLLVAQEGLVSSVRLFPGGINYVDYSAVPSGRPPIDPLQSGAQMPLGLEMENQRRDMIWAAFFRNVLQLPVAAPQMTATEVLERKQEFLRVIGPTFARLEASYIAPMVNRVFGLMMRAGAFAPMPAALQGRRLRFEFDSPVSQAQKQIEALAMRGALEQAAPLLELDPAAADNIDNDKAVRLIFEANGADGLLRGAEDVALLRTVRAEAALIGGGEA